MQGPFGCLDIERNCFSKIRETNKNAFIKDMLRRNEKILSSMRKEEKRIRIQTEVSEEQTNQTILSEIKSNSIRGASWMLKKRKQGVVKRRQGTMK